MKTRFLVLLALSLFAMSASAQTVTLPLTVTTAEAQAVRDAIGRKKNLRTPDTPPVVDDKGNIITQAVPGVPRSATVAEVRAYIADILRADVYADMKAQRQAAALAGVAEPAMINPQ